MTGLNQYQLIPITWYFTTLVFIQLFRLNRDMGLLFRLCHHIWDVTFTLLFCQSQKMRY